ncbi:hypothetical protein VTK56DRAFT_1384 [Thermocarpiscus australiensis]
MEDTTPPVTQRRESSAYMGFTDAANCPSTIIPTATTTKSATHRALRSGGRGKLSMDFRFANSHCREVRRPEEASECCSPTQQYPPPDYDSKPSKRAENVTSSNEWKTMLALDTARESPEGERNPEVRRILVEAIDQLWKRVLSEPDTYVMTKNEFSLFNYFQDRFIDNRLAVAARARYWDSRGRLGEGSGQSRREHGNKQR